MGAPSPSGNVGLIGASSPPSNQAGASSGLLGGLSRTPSGPALWLVPGANANISISDQSAQIWADTPSGPGASRRGFYFRLTRADVAAVGRRAVQPAVAQSATVNPERMGVAVEAIAKFVLQLTILVALSEVIAGRRAVSDAVLIGVLVIAVGWWVTVLQMRRQVRAELRDEWSGSGG